VKATVWTPRAGDYEYDLGDEVDLIASVLERNEPMSRGELSRRVGGRSWGPGVYRKAVRIAIRTGRARSSGNRIGS
jgi:hypothetical protein